MKGSFKKGMKRAMCYALSLGMLGSNVLVAQAEEVTRNLIQEGSYSESSSFEFPAEVDATTTLEAENMRLENYGDSENWPLEVKSGDGASWASEGKFVNSLNANDIAVLYYNAPEAGIYTAEITYRSGSVHNGFSWSEESGKIAAGSVVMGASDASVTQTGVVCFEVLTPGTGKLTIAAGSQGAAQLDKFVFTRTDMKTFSDREVLMKNASANSWSNSGNDGPASYAFNGVSTNWWHSDWDRSSDVNGEVSSTNKIWIQSGFDKVWNVKEVWYTSRTDTTNNRIKDYTISIAKMDVAGNTPAEEDFTQVAEGTLTGTGTARIILDQYYEATHVRITVTDTSSDSKFVTASDITFVGKDVETVCQHESTHVEGRVEATRTENGYTGDTVCDDCEQVVSSGEEIVATGQYTEAEPFVFPSEANGVAVKLEAEHATSIEDDKTTDSEYPISIGNGTGWASNDKFLNCMARNDKAYYAYNAPKAGTYTVTAYYRSGSNENKLAWSEKDSKIDAGQTAALSSTKEGENLNVGTFTFELVVKTAGPGTLILTAPDDGKGPQIDYFDFVLQADKTELKAVLSAVGEKDAADYTTASWEALQAAVTAAQEVVDNKVASQETVDNAKAAVDNEIASLEYVMTGIEISALPEKVEYERGDELSLEGLVVTAHYAGEGEDKVLSSEEYVVTGFDSETAGTKVITVTYGEKTATFDIVVKPCYIVTVDGEEVARGQYNTKVTLTADEKEGQVFAGWMLGETVVSTDEVYTFYMGSDVDLVKKYVDAEEEVTVEPAAIISNVIVTDAVNGKGSVRFVAQLVVPEGYTVEEFGVYWTGKNSTNVPTLVNEDGTVCAPAKKAPAAVKTAGNQFSSTIKNIPVGKTARAVVYMKISDGTTTRWIVSNEQSGTVR